MHLALSGSSREATSYCKRKRGENMTDTLLYEVPKGQDVGSLKNTARTLLKNSQTEIAAILSAHGIPEENTKEIAAQILDASPDVEYKGAGSIGELIAIAISLAPLIKALSPLLLPFSKRGADLAYEIGKDIWNMLKGKLLGENIRLSEKKSAKRG
jgi:hypothetical protein